MLINARNINFPNKLHSIYRYASTKALKDEKIPFNIKKRAVKSPNPACSKEMQKYFESNMRKEVLTTYPEGLLRKKSAAPTGCYLTCKKSARIVADELLRDLPPKLPIIEVNPGNGMITDHILQNTKKNPIFLYEPESYFYSIVLVSPSIHIFHGSIFNFHVILVIHGRIS